MCVNVYGRGMYKSLFLSPFCSRKKDETREEDSSRISRSKDPIGPQPLDVPLSLLLI